MAIPGWLSASPSVAHIEHTPATPGVPDSWPSWLPDRCRAAIVDAGISAPWRHQVELADLVFRGRHAAICTPTASGKTLAYLMPVMAATYSTDGVVGVDVSSGRAQLLARRRHTALYVAPTKALAHDQMRVCQRLGPTGWKVSTLDGDSDRAERRYAREFAGYVLTNPDMLHHSVLPDHARWASLLGSLRYVVIDESHHYRGVFGSHVAQVLRRLRRICRLYGADPTFVLSSATTSDAERTAALLIGADRVEVVANDSSPHTDRDVVLVRPETSLSADAATLLARLIDDGRQTICFVGSRDMSELVAKRAAELRKSDATVAAYRAGYLADERRELEVALHDGSLRGVAATNALELGIDVSGMDAVVICGFPGTHAALWQQAGRAGRANRDALVLLLAREDPLDAYLFDHPELIFDAPVEQAVLYPDNPYVLGRHLAAAAQEAGLTATDARWFGPTMDKLCDQLAAQRVLRRRPSGWFWPHPTRATDSINLRSIGAHSVIIAERETGRVVGQVDAEAADRVVFEGAVYLHQGESWLVDRYEPDAFRALVHRERPGYHTQPLSASTVRVVKADESRRLGAATVRVGEVELTSQVIGYLRRDDTTGEVWDETPLAMAARTLVTRSMWLEIGDDVVAASGVTAARAAAAMHAAEHCATSLLGLFSPCDRWDVGGVSARSHPDTGSCTIFVHDRQPGGAGFADRGFRDAEAWWTATLHRLESCSCADGCPRCVISPTCGSPSRTLDKHGARDLIGAALTDLDHDSLRF